MNGFYDLPFFPIGPNEGTNGKDGVSPTISVENISGGYRLIIVDATGRKTVDVLDGKQGETGPAGIQGPKGETGERGPQGETGATGPEGKQGPQGIQGEQGPKGDTGPTGPQGEPGIQGPQGIPGTQGIQGETGPAGKDGTNGTNGKSAFEFAQDGGFTESESKFAETLANALDKRNIAIGIHSDGLLYLFINGEPIGTGITINTNTEI